jgi:hypothetical protein
VRPTHARKTRVSYSASKPLGKKRESIATKEDTTAETLAIDDGTLEDAIRVRVYEISQSPDAGTSEENWERAARELGPAG